MRWRAKVGVQVACAALPKGIGDALYHRIQTRNGLTPTPSGHVAFLDRIEQHHDIAGAKVVELGAGWFPLTPLLLLARGAAGVQTFDLNQHYSRERNIAAATALLRSGVEGGFLHDVQRTGLLPKEIQYHPGTDLSKADVAQADLAVSRFVLEHVAPESIASIHRSSLSWLDGPWIHWVSPGDHRSYSDARLSSVDFLRYSENRWRIYGGNRFAYHNRLRRPEYRKVFCNSGWTVAVDEASANDHLSGVVSGFDLPARFAEIPIDDLIAGSLWFVLRQSSASAPTAP